SAARIARRLGVSVRTLARRLGECGKTYRELLNEARMRIALRDLAQTLRPIDHIALQLGFSSSQSFHRAFRRWTGDTAASYRERSRRASLLQSSAI
ncbi:MAG TPA: helix-turn-helix transcriptional regulator, partial [Polyangiales bacterium]|nr:helix-turn-helix transcriptional regulator [Polyangiales bacterium]